MPVTNYIYDPVTEAYLMEQDGDGITTAVYTQEPVKYGDILAQHRIDPATGVGESFYYHTDALGSTTELTDSSGTVVNTYTYDAFGNTIASTGTVENPFRFTGNVGYYFDEELNTYHIRARNYQPTNGRWMSQDPIGFERGDVNLYRYVENSPVTNIDPSGLTQITCELGLQHRSGSNIRNITTTVNCPSSDGLKCCQTTFPKNSPTHSSWRVNSWKIKDAGPDSEPVDCINPLKDWDTLEREAERRRGSSGDDSGHHCWALCMAVRCAPVPVFCQIPAFAGDLMEFTGARGPSHDWWRDIKNNHLGGRCGVETAWQNKSCDECCGTRPVVK